MFWGLTPALDLQEELTAKCPNEINILIVGGQDCRHVLKTLARRYRHEPVRINFFLMEAILETVAKQILLLNIALQPEKELGTVQKGRYFMELYGNTLIRPAVAKYLKLRATELVKMITNFDYLKEIMPYLKIDLKYKERDYIENVFKFWCSNDDFDIQNTWDQRLRKMLGIRYDTRMAAFDWDLFMRFHNIGGLQICAQEYKHWRATGVAFTWLESEVSKTNRSFVCGVIPNGQQFGHCGYLGDMQMGPFVTFGLDCEDPEFLKKVNGLNAQRATDVTERNLLQIFHELQSNEEYVHVKMTSRNMGASTYVQSDLKVVDFGADGDVNVKKSKRCINLNDLEIKFITIANLKMMKHKEEYHDFFNLIYFASTYLKYFESDVIEKVAAPNSLLLIENQIFVLSYRDKQLKEFELSMKEKVNPISNIYEVPFNVKKDCYAKFILKGES